MDLAHKAPLSMEFSSGLPIPSPGDLHNSGFEPLSPALQAFSCILGGFLTNEATRENFLGVRKSLLKYPHQIPFHDLLAWTWYHGNAQTNTEKNDNGDLKIITHSRCQGAATMTATQSVLLIIQ